MIGRLTIACIAAAALTVAPAIIEGLYNNRWGVAPNMDAAAEQLKKMPRDFGHWTFVRDGEPVSDMVKEALALAGSLSRDYVNREDGTNVSLLLMVGESGPLMRHPPNICYANRANQQVGEMTKFHVDTTKPASEFNLLVYRRPQALTNDRFLVAYSMAVGPKWSAPTMPRLEFGGAPLLYKVQMLTVLDPSQDTEKGIATLQKFADEFCSVFQERVVSKDGS
jgi:hypothetical protein